MLSKKQEPLYWRAWGAVKKAAPEVDRKAFHAQASPGWPEGLPVSHKDWGNQELDEWLSRCRAIAAPGDYQAQMRQIRQPQTRWLETIRTVCAALDADMDYVEGIARQMNLRGKIGGAWATLETVSPKALEGIFIALKIECRRRWPRKANLLLAFPEKERPGAAKTDYDQLIALLGAQKTASKSPPAPETDDPF